MYSRFSFFLTVMLSTWLYVLTSGLADQFYGPKVILGRRDEQRTAYTCIKMQRNKSCKPFTHGSFQGPRRRSATATSISTPNTAGII
jgi:hypothetical protein